MISFHTKTKDQCHPLLGDDKRAVVVFIEFGATRENLGITVIRRLRGGAQEFAVAWILKLLPVYIDNSLVDSDHVSRQGDAALQVPHLSRLAFLISISGPVEDDHVPLRDITETGDSKMRNANRRERYCIRCGTTVDEFADEKPVPYFYRILHGPGWDLKGCQNEAVDHEDGKECVNQISQEGKAL